MKKPRLDYLRLLALLIVISGIAYFYLNIFSPRHLPRWLRVGTSRRPMNILILGTDANFSTDTGRPVYAGEGRTDSILLMHLDPSRYKLILLSIPRDSFVEIPGFGQQKINAANVLGGTELVKKTVSNLMGINIDNYIKVNPEAAIKLVDLFGGVKIYVDEDMYYIDNAQKLYINLKKGWHKLSGKEAEGYFRFRHDATADIGRMARQQKFLEALFRSFTYPPNLLKAPAAAEIAGKYIKTDLSLAKIVRLANFARMLSPADITTIVATGEEASSSYAGNVLLPNRQFISGIVRQHLK